MKKRIFLQILVLLILLFSAAIYMVSVGIKYGQGNRALLTMRSGLIKMRKGINEFIWGFKKYAIKGIEIQRQKLNIQEQKELRQLEIERQLAELEAELPAEPEPEVIEIEPEIEDIEVAAEVAVAGDGINDQEQKGEKDEEIL